MFLLDMVNRIRLSRTIQWSNAGSTSWSLLDVPTPSSESLILAAGTFKTEILKIWRRLSDSNQFVDVGMNIGQTMLEVLGISRELDYYGFEPNMFAFSVARSLAEANALSVNLFPWACSSEAAPIEFYASSLLDTSATLCPSIRPNTYAGVAPQWIAAYPLDSVLGSSLRHGFLMKIDVEGSENEVLIGAMQLIQEKRPLILCEVLHAHRESEIGSNNWRKIKLLELILEFQYSLYRVDLDPLDREKFLGISKVESFPMNRIWKDSPHTCDYLFVPQEVPLEMLMSKEQTLL